MHFAKAALALSAPFLVSAFPMKHKRASDNDILVLQFAEVLERLETQFYQDALNKFVVDDFINAGINVPDVAIQNFQGILAHEIAHTSFLQAALDAVGAPPVEGCTFNFDDVLTDVATMTAVARVVEAVGVGAYIGASTLVDSPDILAAAASILTIESRHQSFLNTINGATHVPQAFDIALTPPQVLSIAGGFITGCSLGIEGNAPLRISNEGVVAPGTLLTFEVAGLEDTSGLSCQMLAGGLTTAISLPIEACIVPDNLNGPVAIFLTSDANPLSANVVQQDGSTTVAGPTLAFIDTVSDALGALVRAGGDPLDSTEELSPEDAQRLVDENNGEESTPDPAAPTDSTAPVPDPLLNPDAPVDPTLPPEQVAPAVPEQDLDPNAPPADGAANPSTPPTGTPPIKVIGHSTIPL